MNDDPVELVDSVAVGKELGLSRDTVLRWADAGKLPYRFRLPGERGAYRFNMAEVIAYLEDRSGDE